MSKVGIAIHGGAGTILKRNMTDEKEARYKTALKESLDAGYTILNSGGSALDAVEAAVRSLEDTPLFNAGKGAVFTADGTHEMDASIMDGSNLDAGAVSGVGRIKNPISLAKSILINSEHVFLAGEGAEKFAKLHGLEFEDASYFFDDYRHKQWLRIKDTDELALDHTEDKDRKFGTVGAVALDQHGNLAAATSTGGMTNKRFGRIGDSPMIGAGTYANNSTCAVSCTGSGEYFIRAVVAYDVSCLMSYKGMNLKDASAQVVHNHLKDINGDGGLIAIDKDGNIEMPFNTEGMYRASKNEDMLRIEIYGV